MKKRILSALTAMALALTLVSPSAMALGSELGSDPMGVGGGEIIALPMEETAVLPGVGSINDIPDPAGIPSLMGLDSTATAFNENYYNQLDALSKAVYDAMLTSAGSGPVATLTALSDAANTEIAKQSFTGSAILTIERKTEGDKVTYSYSVDAEKDDNGNPVATSALGAFSAYFSGITLPANLALQYDHPELSWLVNTATTYSYIPSMTTTDELASLYEEEYKKNPSATEVSDGKVTVTKDSVTVTVTGVSVGMHADGVTAATTEPAEGASTKEAFNTANTGDLQTIKGAINTAKTGVDEKLAGKTSTYDKVKAIHDWICEKVTYADKDSAKFINNYRGYQTAYSALVDPRTTVCAGYAKAFKLLCGEYGIPCVVVSGTGSGEAHAWNYVYLDNDWYAVDCTWDDQESGTIYTYFLKGSGSFNTDHTPSGKWSDSSEVTFTYPGLSTADYVHKEDLAGRVSIEGDGVFGTQLTAAANVTNSDWNSKTPTYTWYRSTEQVGTGATYTVKADDVATAGTKLTVKATHANYSGELTAEKEVSKATAKVTVSANPTAIKVGGTAAISAAVNTVTGPEIGASPNVTYAITSGADVISLSGTTVTGNKAGTATITATFKADGYEDATGTVDITVSDKDPVVTDLKITGLEEDGTAVYGNQLSVNGTFASSATAAYQWYVNNVSISGATASTYTVRREDIGSKLSVKVSDSNGTYADVTSAQVDAVGVSVKVELTVNPTALKVGGTATASATVTPTNGPKENTALTKPAVTYSSSNTGVASVDVNGKVTANAAGEADITATFSDTAQGYVDAASEAVKVSVTEKDELNVTIADVSVAVGDTATVSPVVKDKNGTNTLTPTTDYTVAYEAAAGSNVATVAGGTVTGKNVGSVKVTATITPAGTYTADYKATTKEFTVTVTSKTVDPTVELPSATYTYNGSAQTPEPVVKVGEVTLTKGADYTVTYSDNINAGTAKVIVTAVANRNYTWSPAKEVTFTINQATAAKTASVYVKNDGATTQTVNLAALLPAGEPGTASYAVTPAPTKLETASVDGNGVLSLKSKADTDAPADGATEDVTVEVTGLTNYSKITITVHVTFTSKNSVTLTVNPAANLTYDGTAKDVTVAGGPEGAAYTYLYTGTTAKGDVYSAATAPTAAGSYSVSVSFVNAENAYTGNAAFTIAPKAVTVKGITQTIKVNAQQLPVLYKVEGLVGGETTLNASISVTCGAVAGTVGTYPITVDGPAVSTDGNYSITYQPGNLTIEALDQVATPVASPNGGTFTDSVSVTLSCATEGATIYYTTNGNTPTGQDPATYAMTREIATEKGTTYTGPITRTESTTIKAIAVLAGMDSSAVMTAVYTKQAAPVTPPVVHVTGVSLDQSALHLTVGGTAQLIASVVPGNADNRDVTWSSSDPTVASVSGGAVTALRAGSAVITVTTVDGGFAASCAVTVTAPVAPPVNPGGSTGPVTPVVPNPGAPGGSGSNNNNSSSNNNNNNNTSTPGDSNTSAPSTPSDSPVVPEATVSGGTAAAQVTNDQAAQLVDQAASGNSTVVIAPEVSGDVSRTEVSIPASAVSGIASGSSAALKVETPAANITISNSGLSDLGGQDVVVAAEKVGSTVSVEITAGGQPVSTVTGGVKAEIPADCGPGTVAQVVDENGNVLATVRKSFASAGGDTMNVPLDGSAKVVFVDNSKSFADVPANNWAANAVAFASGHELMNGVSATSFSPAEPMTRGMLAVVLHNLEGNPSASYSGSFGDVSGNAWYAEAVQWAADNSIIGGVGDGSFAPDASITREQLVVMLYRYAGQPEAGSGLGGFSDAGSVSSWAQQAMAWAVSSGIVGGSNGALNPQSGATRAEVAQMLMNFVSSGAI